MKPYYEEDGITIYHGDCREILPTLAFDAIVSDPPFGTEDLRGGYGRRQNWDNGNGKGRVIAGDKDLAALEGMFLALQSNVRIMWLAVFFAARKTPEFVSLATRYAAWRGELVWNKRMPGLGYTIRYSHESIALLSRGDPPKPPDALLSVIEAPCVADVHPHEKPVELMKPLVKFCALENDTVLDPFMGSGTTLRAAKDLGRKAIGIEIEEKYAEIAAKRLSQKVLDFGYVFEHNSRVQKEGVDKVAEQESSANQASLLDLSGVLPPAWKTGKV